MQNSTLRSGIRLIAAGVVSMMAFGHVCFAADAEKPVDPASNLAALPGFKIETVLEGDAKVASYISMSKDSQGRLLLGAQRRQPATRLTLDANGRITKQESLQLPVTEIMGQLFVGDTLYADAAGKGPDGKEVYGLFRLSDPKGDGSYSSFELLREWEHGAGEHGSHGIVLAPDGKHIFTVSGNFTGVPTDLAATSPHKNYGDDLALPRAEDGNGFGAGKKPPGGFITRMDMDGKNAEMFSSGQRNTYDIAFNADGELFGFDSDMEWDWGMPWYRPIRVFHATSAGDGGFREGSAKWPQYYEDSLPSVVDIGIGCPTGTVFGTGAKFPAAYQKAYYILDWTYGRLIAVHMTPQGSSYTATWENFVAPKALHEAAGKTPLNLTDVVIGNDGALYFTIGGRNTPAKLFRVTYVGKESTAPADLHDAAGAEARALRHKIEAFHGRVDPKAVETVWQYLSSDDRYIRYAARIAVEAQPLDSWKAKALAETNPQAALTALLSVARLGAADVQKDVVASLGKFSLASLPPAQQMLKLRVLEVSISRQGKPNGAIAKAIADDLSPLYPAKTVELNRELTQVLLAIDAPGAVAKTVKLLTSAPTQEEQFNYALALRTITTGWTPELRKEYFTWFNNLPKDGKHPEYVTKWFDDAGRPYADGSSFNKFVDHLQADAKASLASASTEDVTAVSSIVEAYKSHSQMAPKKVKNRPLIRNWVMDELEPSLASVGKGRNFNRGKTIFEEAQCLACHKFGNEGGSGGPDLTAVATRFGRHDILESIILPSKVISEQYMNTEVKTKSGDVEVGRLVEENNDKIVLQPNLLKLDRVTVQKSEIVLRRLSKISPMPEGLVNTFNKEEILDLLAYVESAGNKNHPDFAKVSRK